LILVIVGFWQISPGCFNHRKDVFIGCSVRHNLIRIDGSELCRFQEFAKDWIPRTSPITRDYRLLPGFGLSHRHCITIVVEIRIRIRFHYDWIAGQYNDGRILNTRGRTRVFLLITQVYKKSIKNLKFCVYSGWLWYYSSILDKPK